MGRSTREIGIRMSLGAERSEIARMILRSGLTAATAGIAIGCITAFLGSTVMSAHLFGAGAVGAKEAARPPLSDLRGRTRVPNEWLRTTPADSLHGSAVSHRWGPLAVNAPKGGPALTGGRILVVDDDPDVRRSHRRLLERLGHEIETAADGVEALALLPLDFDLVLVDADMPGMDGFEVARRIREDPNHGHIPIVMVTGLADRQDRLRAYEMGVNDFLAKPIEATELRIRIRGLLELKSARDELERYRDDLERTVERRTRDLKEALRESAEAKRQIRHAHLDTIHRLSVAAEYKDRVTADHIERIGRFSELVARTLGLAPGEIELIRHASPMHDVGKLGIPDGILLKPGRLEDDEMEVMRTHARIGADLLSDSTSDVIRMGQTIALAHHERWDGGGYPQGLAEDEIPLAARICATADVFDALTSDRPYRAPLDNEEVYRMLRDEAGAHFDPRIVEAFLDVRERVEEIQAEYRNR